MLRGKLWGKNVYIHIYIHIFKKRLEMSSRNLWRRSFRGGQILQGKFHESNGAPGIDGKMLQVYVHMICIYIYYYRHFKISSICLHDKKMPAFVRDIPLPFRCTYSIIFDDTRVVVKNQDLCMGFCPALCLTGAATWMCTF